uniref:Uncharacterized protein n=1 Tax=Rhizophora mucronata TaxID=61149 RepID=A0A2P2LYA6_RHIMU
MEAEGILEELQSLDIEIQQVQGNPSLLSPFIALLLLFF